MATRVSLVGANDMSPAAVIGSLSLTLDQRFIYNIYTIEYVGMIHPN